MTADPPRLPFTNAVKARGKVYWFFRSRQTGHVKLRGAPGDAIFHQDYGAAMALRERAQSDESPAAEDSFAWLIDRYLESAEFRALADATQDDYSKTCQLLKDEMGVLPYRFITRAALKTVRDDHANQTRKANKIAQMASCLYGWGNGADLVPDGVNPAFGLKKLKRKGGVRHYVPWSDPEIAWALAEATPHEKTPLLIFLYTGQRCADVCAMTWLQWQDDLVRVRTAKTHQLIDMPCHPLLKAHLADLRKGAKVVQLTGPICLNKDGKPFTPGALGGVIRRLVERCPRIPDNRSPHGLRYAAAARMDEGGATPVMIGEVLGQRTYRIAMQYAQGRLRAAQGIAAMKGSEA